jgi:hypothetical protein
MYSFKLMEYVDTIQSKIVKNKKMNLRTNPNIHINYKEVLMFYYTTKLVI